MVDAVSRSIAPLSADDFSSLMADFGPFERPPALAVAVSGGADSMALACLAQDWAGSHGGSIQALTVDHGLRKESRAEARQVGRWLAARGIAHTILTWRGDKPSAGIQAAAREGRYALLENWCRNKGVLHLLLAHHLEDQAETFLLRLGRGSGLAGLAGMAAVEYREGLRLLRPLLAVPKVCLAATLTARGQDWVEDPSNRNEKFRRVRARTILAGLAPEGLEAARIADAAARLRRASDAIDAQVSDVLVEAVIIHPEGYARLDAAALRAAPEEASLRALSRVLMTVSGQVYPPRFERLRHLHGGLADLALRRSGGRTLHGCRIAPGSGAFRASRYGLVVTREMSAIGDPVTLAAGASAVWDGRFRIGVVRSAGTGRQSWRVQPLGKAGWTEIRGQVNETRATAIPAAARLTLPAFYDGKGVVAMPHLDFVRRGAQTPKSAFTANFAPMLGLTA